MTYNTNKPICMSCNILCTHARREDKLKQWRNSSFLINLVFLTRYTQLQ